MSDWGKGWMNSWLTCPFGDHGIHKGYTAPDFELNGRCFICNGELEGFRILKENA